MPHMEKCTPNSQVTPLNQRVWLGSKQRASQYQIDDHPSSSLKAIFHCSRFSRPGGATNFNHVKNQSRGQVKKFECSSTFMACPRAFKRTKNAPGRQLQRNLSNVGSARAGKATAMEYCLSVLRYYQRSAADQYLFTFSHQEPQYLYYKHIYSSHGQGYNSMVMVEKLKRTLAEELRCHSNKFIRTSQLVWARKTRLIRSSLFQKVAKYQPMSQYNNYM